MKQVILILILIATTSTAIGKGSRQGDMSTAQSIKEIVKLEHAWAEAMKSHDVRALSRILADDYRDTSSTGTVRDKRQELELLTTANLRFIAYEPDEIDVRIYGNVAVVTGLLRMKVSYESQEAFGELRYTTMYVKRRGLWQAVASQTTQIAQQ